MNNNNEKDQLAGIAHELRSQIDVILSYGNVAAGSSDPLIQECAKKINAAAAGMTGIIDGLLDKSAEYGGLYGREQRSVPVAAVPETQGTPLVLIIDDDELICESVAAMLGKIFRTETAISGAEALEKLASIKPSLILLDINMQDMDGFETLSRIRQSHALSSIPVIFLTGDEGRDAEIRCLRAGAADFVRKPLASQVLIERVRRIIELDRLQNYLSSEVAVQTKRSAHLSKQIMLALAQAVDAKDHYTNGHSQRVAAYSAEIARRMGKSKQEQDEIYSMGLLHDVGKIGVSEAIINKTSRLDDSEYAQIKKHTEIGHGILKLITEIPGLATGARWHHERYDGKGYPDGLSGVNIPEEARIICVADCYDAMTSNRSYSTVREQAAVRAEIIRCKGTQFDPVIADIMTAMIDDDPEYKMSEREGHNAVIPSPVSDMQTVCASPANTDTDKKPSVLPSEAMFIPEIAELDILSAKSSISDEEILALTIRRFYELMPVKLEKLKTAYNELCAGGDISAYRITVHSMKTSAATIGLTSLSEAARSLEMLAGSAALDEIHKQHAPFVNEWERIYDKLGKEYDRLAPVTDTQERPDGTAKLSELLEALRAYMRNMDMDSADETMALIEKFSYSQSVRRLTGELKKAVLALDEELAEEIISELIKEITI
ncbi:MAG TPA: hypothetical protein DDX72_10015 [Ruminococcaceae bacterium]|nr:hypothetical protein [Oscillospiraceae bacterium]